MFILVVNGGSTSYKFSCFEFDQEKPLDPPWKAIIEEKAAGEFYFRIESSQEKQEGCLSEDRERVIKQVLSSLWSGPCALVEGKGAIGVIGHRIVHGGGDFETAVFIEDKTLAQIVALTALAPLHQPFHVQMIRWLQKWFPKTPQVAVFDTAFHRTMPEYIQTYPIPLEWKQRGIIRYGFHGISHQYSLERAAALVNKECDQLRMISCHLGGGCSLCAIKEGKSYETTMGLTPLEGLMMGSRSGSIDPGILLYLMREEKFSLQQLEQMLTQESGLKGIAGSGDMRAILQQQDQRESLLAKQMFVHRVKTAIGAMAASLGGVDLISFTGGIGEGSFRIREEVLLGLHFLGVRLDSEKNRAARFDSDIGEAHSAIRLLVIQCREEWMIAKECFAKMI